LSNRSYRFGTCKHDCRDFDLPTIEPIYSFSIRTTICYNLTPVARAIVANLFVCPFMGGLQLSLSPTSFLYSKLCSLSAISLLLQQLSPTSFLYSKLCSLSTRSFLLQQLTPTSFLYSKLCSLSARSFLLQQVV